MSDHESMRELLKERDSIRANYSKKE